MEIHVRLGGNRADFFDRLDAPDLIVRVHDRDEDGVGPNGAANIFRINQAVARKH